MIRGRFSRFTLIYGNSAPFCVFADEQRPIYHVSMPRDSGIASLVRLAARSKILFLPHALRQMMRPDRMILRKEVRSAILDGEVVEDYPEDVRGHSCLMLGFGDDGRPVHVVCSPKDDYLVVITAYVPTSEKWSSDYCRRMEP